MTFKMQNYSCLIEIVLMGLWIWLVPHIETNIHGLQTCCQNASLMTVLKGFRPIRRTQVFNNNMLVRRGCAEK